MHILSIEKSHLNDSFVTETHKLLIWWNQVVVQKTTPSCDVGCVQRFKGKNQPVEASAAVCFHSVEKKNLWASVYQCCPSDELVFQARLPTFSVLMSSPDEN